MYVTVNESELYAKVRGHGRPVVLVHPLLLDGTVWTYQQHALAGRRNVVAPDLRGHGRSDPLVESVIDFDRFAEDVVGLLEWAGEGTPCDLVGLSLGGLFAAMAAVRAPALVRSLSLLSVPFGTDTPAYARYREEMAALAVRESRDAVYRRWAEYIFGSEPSLFAKARYKEMLTRTPHETFVAVMAGTAHNDVDRTALLEELSVPTLMIVGEHDKIYGPEFTRPLASRITRGRLAVIPSGGRLLPLETPERLSDVLMGFLDSVDASVG